MYKPSYVIAMRDWVQRCIESGDPKFIVYVTGGVARRIRKTTVAAERRSVYQLNHLAAEVAYDGTEPSPKAV